MSLRQGQRGFSLIGTLFVLVVVSLLGAYMVQIGSAQHLQVAMSAQGLRAHYAAHSGLEWLAHRLRRDGACPVQAAPLAIEGFSVRIARCDAWPVTEGARNYTVYDVTVTAERNAFGHVDHVSRTLRAALEGP